MKIDLESTMTITVSLFTILAGIYPVARIEGKILNKFDKLESRLLTELDKIEDEVTEKFYNIKSELSNHFVEHKERKIFDDYKVEGLNQLVEHKFKRLANWINQITEYLNHQSGFTIKDDKY